jgi:hypothetical protein
VYGYFETVERIRGTELQAAKLSLGLSELANCDLADQYFLEIQLIDSLLMQATVTAILKLVVSPVFSVAGWLFYAYPFLLSSSFAILILVLKFFVKICDQPNR